MRRLPVVDAGGRLVGIVTERDLHRLMIFALPGTVASGPLLLRDAALFTDLYELTMAAGRGPGGVTAGGRRDEGREGGQP